MNVEQAREILADENADTVQGLEAVAVMMRFHGIAKPRYLEIAKRVEAVIADLHQHQQTEKGTPHESP